MTGACCFETEQQRVFIFWGGRSFLFECCCCCCWSWSRPIDRAMPAGSYYILCMMQLNLSKAFSSTERAGVGRTSCRDGSCPLGLQRYIFFIPLVLQLAWNKSGSQPASQQSAAASITLSLLSVQLSCCNIDESNLSRPLKQNRRKIGDVPDAPGKHFSYYFPSLLLAFFLLDLLCIGSLNGYRQIRKGVSGQPFLQRLYQTLLKV